MKWFGVRQDCSRLQVALSFTGEPEGHLIALGAHNGKVLWHFQTGASIKAPPISYSLRGTQFIAIAAGPNVIAFKVR